MTKFKPMSEIEYKIATILIYRKGLCHTQKNVFGYVEHFKVNCTKSYCYELIGRFMGLKLMTLSAEEGYVLTEKGMELWRKSKEHYQQIISFLEVETNAY